MAFAQTVCHPVPEYRGIDKYLADLVKSIGKTGQDLNQKFLTLYIKGTIYFFKYPPVGEAIRQTVKMGGPGNHDCIEFEFFLQHILYIKGRIR